MINQFQSYLIKQGYSLTTPAGSPSTVYNYTKQIEKVCEWENITPAGLAQNINVIIAQYDVGGRKEDLGHKSHNSVISALKRFSEFLTEK